MSNIDRAGVMMTTGIVGLAVAYHWTGFLIGYVATSVVCFIVYAVVEFVRPGAADRQPRSETE